MANIVYPAAQNNVQQAMEAVVAAADLPEKIDLAQLPGYKVADRPVLAQRPATGFWAHLLGKTQEVQVGNEWVHSWLEEGRWQTRSTPTPSAQVPAGRWYVRVEGVAVYAISGNFWVRRQIGYLPQPVASIEDLCPSNLLPDACDQGSGAYPGKLVFLDELEDILKKGVEKVRAVSARIALSNELAVG